MSRLTLYIDYLSQPSRAVLAFCLINNIPFTVKEVEILKGETNSKEFEAISPTRTVPAITHNGLCLYESHAIMIYLSSVFPIEDQWYPKDPAQQALVNIYLHWHHLNTRYGCGYYLYNKIIRPLLNSSKKMSQELESEFVFTQQNSLRFIENILATGKYVGRTTKPSIADISFYCEIINLGLINFDFSPYPNLIK